MSVYKEGNGWTAYIYYVDWQGNKKRKKKMGFATKREAKEYETQFLLSKSRDVNMKFNNFIDIYMADIKPRIKYNTYVSKEYLINDKIRPYLGEKSLCEINSADIVQWQNVMLSKRDKNDKGYSSTYLRTVQNQLSAIFNHAVKYYGLKENPSTKAGKMGKKKAKEMKFWTKEEYLKFRNEITDNPEMYCAFEVLYWTGIREGELLALTMEDFDLTNRKLRINKSYQKIASQDFITDPKTEKSNRVIDLPVFLCEEVKNYIDMLYKPKKTERIFTVNKYSLHRTMVKGATAAGVKSIRIHDLRHSHVALLIELGYSPVAIATRMGHESIEITLNYAHLYPSTQLDMVAQLDKLGRIE